MMKRFFLILLLILPTLASAEIDANNNAQTILQTFAAASHQWVAAIKPAGMYLFTAFVTIDMVLTSAFMAFKVSEIGEFIAELIRKIMWIGFFLALFKSAEWLTMIPESFSELAFKASGMKIQPDTILETAMRLVTAVWTGAGILNIDGWAALFAGIICLVAFAMMAAQLFITLIKIQAIIAGSYLIFAFGGLSYTRSMAINPLKALFAAGMELMFIKLFLALTISTMEEFEKNASHDMQSAMTIIVVSVLLASVVQMIPGIVNSLMSGTLGNNSTAGLGIAAAAIGGAVAGGAMAAKTGAGVSAAVKAAQELSKAGGGSTTGNIIRTVGKDVMDTISGKNARDTTSTGQRAADNMKQKTNGINSAKEAAAAKEAASYVNGVDSSAFAD